METAISYIFVFVSLYTIKHRLNIVLLLVSNYIMTILMQWYGMDFGINFKVAVLYPADIINILLSGFIVVSFIKKHKKSNFIGFNKVFFYIFVIIIAIQTAIGLFVNGMNADFMGDFRKFLNLIVPIIYFSQFPLDIKSEYTQRILNYTMNLVLGFCYVYWIVYIATGYNFEGSESSMRCFHSDAAIVVALYTIYLVYKDVVLSEKKALSIRTILFLLSVIMLQHNSVYSSLIAGLAIIFWEYRKFFFVKRVKFIAQISCLVIVAVVVIMSMEGNPIMQSLSETFTKFEQARTTGEGTIGTRYEIWEATINTLNTVPQWLFGMPLGNGYHVVYRGGIWQVSPHSGYIETLMRSGLIGFISLFIFIISIFVMGIRRKEYLLSALVIAMMVYWYPYSYTMEAGVVLGCVIGYMKSNSNSTMSVYK